MITIIQIIISAVVGFTIGFFGIEISRYFDRNNK